MDLDAFAAIVDQRRSAWEQLGIKVEFRGPPTWSAVALVNCEGEKKVAELVVWKGGRAVLETARLDSTDDPSVHIFRIVSEIGLRGCLDDLTKYVLTED